MAWIFETTTFPVVPDGNSRDAVAAVHWKGIFFRTLVDLGTGDVAGIEPVPAQPAAVVSPLPVPDGLDAWFHGRERGLPVAGKRPLRRKAAYLVRCDLTLRPERMAAALGIAPGRAILMFDVAGLCRDPGRALDVLLCCKRAGARILLDNFDLEDPPARFMEMLPADILRVSPRRMPWHWDVAKRRELLASLLAYAENLLMDVAVEDVSSGWQRQEYKRLGVRYVQGGWSGNIAERMFLPPHP